MFIATSRRVGMETFRLAALARMRPLTIAQLAQVAPYASESSVGAGKRVLLDGPFAQELVLVGSGRGRVRCAGETVAEIGPGDVFGTLAPSRVGYATATVTAISDLELVMFSTRDVRTLRTVAPETLAAVLEACALDPDELPAAPRLTLAPAA